MRMIDASALEARMYHDAFEVDSDMQKWDSGCWIRYKMFENAIKEAPTIEERKTGKWLETDSHEPCWFKCDQCGRLSDIKEIYCPTCGASMVNTTCGADMRGET